MKPHLTLKGNVMLRLEKSTDNAMFMLHCTYIKNCGCGKVINVDAATLE